MRIHASLVLVLVACGGANSDGSTGPETATDDLTGPSPTTQPTSAPDATSQPTGDATGDATTAAPTSAGPTSDATTDLTTTGEPPADALPVGHCGALAGRYFAADTWIYADISDAPVRPDSAATTAWLAAQGGWGNDNRFQIDTSFIINDADASAPKVTRTPADPVPYSADCDPGVMFPIPEGARIEGLPDLVCPGRVDGDYQGDCHLLVADFDGGVLYESYRATYTGGQYYTECDVAWDMTLDAWGPPPAPGSALPPVEQYQWGIGRDCTGPDAAGFPIAPLLFTVGDVMAGKVQHAIRFILPNDRMQRAPNDAVEGPMYVWPASHAGGPQAIDPAAPIYGSRWRLRPDFDPAAAGLDPTNPVVVAVVWGLQHHGMLLADGGNIALTAESSDGCGQTWDDLWGEHGPRVLDGIAPTDFEIIDVGEPEMGYDCVRNPNR
ncbi:MAG: hypothetical protein JNL82_13500 [Myxococcales bacterium]|nr:hypothetical protein [Myxococcales bacterium]